MVGHKKLAVFTMDVEYFTDTGCIKNSDLTIDKDMLDGLDEYISILDKYGIKATLFTMSEVAEKLSEKLKGYIKSGHDIALHGYEHIAPITVRREEFKANMKLAKQRIEHILGTTVKGFRAPFFGLDNERLEVLTELGFKYDSSRFDFPKRDYAGEIDITGFTKHTDNVFSRNGFFEFGMPCKQFLGLRVPLTGGGYARISNWGFFSSMLYSYLQKNDYYVFYLHPFELSKEKMPPTPRLKGYDQYYLRAGVKSYPYKIELIIRMLKKLNYEFVTFAELAERLEKR